MMNLSGFDPDELAQRLYDEHLRDQQFPIAPEFLLTEQERDSAVWKKIVAYLSATRDRLREENDQHCREALTIARRGKLEMLKSILELGEDRVPEPPEDPDPGY